MNKITGKESVSPTGVGQITSDADQKAIYKYYGYSGITLRQYFAAMAMQGILANAKVYRDSSLPSVCEQAIYQADALISELNKTPSNE